MRWWLIYILWITIDLLDFTIFYVRFLFVIFKSHLNSKDILFLYHSKLEWECNRKFNIPGTQSKENLLESWGVKIGIMSKIDFYWKFEIKKLYKSFTQYACNKVF